VPVDAATDSGNLKYRDVGSWESGKWLGDSAPSADGQTQPDGPQQKADGNLQPPDAKKPPDTVRPPDAKVLPPDSGCALIKEKLDGKDNNCNGQTDEGFWTAPQNASYGVLAGEHPGCRASSAFSDVCMAAASRRCKKLGYSGGFGPVEFGPTSGTIVCLANASRFTVNISALTKRHPNCTAGAIFSLFCNSAIHRECVARGFVSGVGPVEHSNIVAHVVCTNHARLRQVSFTELATHHSGCRANRSFTPDCHAAINRYCTAKGHRAGNGPVEQGANAWVTCLDQR